MQEMIRKLSSLVSMGKMLREKKVELDMRYGKGLGIIKIIPHTYLQGTVFSALHTYYLISSLNLENKLV